MIAEACAARILLFRRQSLQRVDLPLLSWPTNEDFLSLDVQAWLAKIFAKSSREQPYPAYDRSIARQVSKRLDKALSLAPAGHEGDVDDDLMAWIVESVGAAEIEPDDDDYHWAKYVPPWIPFDMSTEESDAVFVLENPRILAANGSTAHGTWAASLHFASVMRAPFFEDLLGNSNVLELGTGCGFASLAVAKYSDASGICATDIDTGALHRVSKAATKLGLAEPILTTAHLAWGPLSESELHKWDAFDTILATDVTYDPSVIVDFVATVSSLLHHDRQPELRRRRAVVVMTVRKEDALESLQHHIGMSRLSIKEIGSGMEFQSHEALSAQTGFFHRCGNGVQYKIVEIERCFAEP